VDALFGTGLSRPVTGHLASVIEAINACEGSRVAVDIPSGLSADTGEVLGTTVSAACTVTMAFLKVGLVSSPGYVHCGKVHVAEIGIPRKLAVEAGVSTFLLESDDVAAMVPPLGAEDHKNRRGHLLAIAGSPGKRGAGRLVSWAALRAGAGLVTLASPWAGGEVEIPDPVMTAELDIGADSATAALEKLAALAAGKQALAIGPGMLTCAGGRALVMAVLSSTGVPAVLDADALNHLAGNLDAAARATCPLVLTPHPGEAARLLQTTSAQVQGDRVAGARELAARTRAVVVLKGARTVICDGRQPSRPVYINPTGNAGLATAGTGDVLTGIIGGLLAQGVDAGQAAQLGVYIHGRAGDLATAGYHPRSLTAADLADRLPEVYAELDEV
jgi:NAD(P)H-hydrate epimerase